MKFAILSIALITITIQSSSLIDALSYRELFQQEWNTYKDSFSKQYETQEDEFRFRVYMENKHMIAKHNQKASRGEKSYFLATNEFADLMHHEFVQLMNGYQHHLKQKSSNGSLFLTPHHVQLPKEIDWRKHKLVTPVKNQGHCGSCWSFSAVCILF